MLITLELLGFPLTQSTQVFGPLPSSCVSGAWVCMRRLKHNQLVNLLVFILMEIADICLLSRVVLPKLELGYTISSIDSFAVVTLCSLFWAISLGLLWLDVRVLLWSTHVMHLSTRTLASKLDCGQALGKSLSGLQLFFHFSGLDSTSVGVKMSLPVILVLGGLEFAVVSLMLKKFATLEALAKGGVSNLRMPCVLGNMLLGNLSTKPIAVRHTSPMSKALHLLGGFVDQMFFPKTLVATDNLKWTMFSSVMGLFKKLVLRFWTRTIGLLFGPDHGSLKPISSTPKLVHCCGPLNICLEPIDVWIVDCFVSVTTCLLCWPRPRAGLNLNISSNLFGNLLGSLSLPAPGLRSGGLCLSLTLQMLPRGRFMHGKPEGLKGGGTTSLIQSTRTLSRQSSNLPAQNRALKDRARFLRQIQVAQKSLVPPEMTYLESRSVRLPTLKDYTNRRNIFLKWCQVHGMETLTEHQLDQALVEYLEFLFSEGMKIDSGIRIHAAMRFFNPALGRPSSGSLARTVKALKGWSHAAPPMQRLPLPIEVLGAIIGLLIQKNLMEIGIRLLLQFICYLRPGECSNLTVKQLVPPQQSVGMRFQFWALLLHPVEEGVPGKTNVYDATVLIDTELWLSPFFKKLIEAKGQDDPLWTHPHEMVVNSFRTCVEELGLTQLGTCLYTLPEPPRSSILEAQFLEAQFLSW